MSQQNEIIIKGLAQNNLKNVSLSIPKGKIVVFTGVSGSGKSSIVFDTIAAESQRQMNETYPAFVRGRLPKHEKPHVERIENLSPSEGNQKALCDLSGYIFCICVNLKGYNFFYYIKLCCFVLLCVRESFLEETFCVD